ncbi:MAG: hypothetical protein LBL65_08365, partial [Campylobacteraceae bacterium]|nr:hypothetical protein [Campylobacteraceae bacterium]
MELRELILRNHRAWLVGMLENLEDLGSLQGDALDIAESANQADFRDCMFDSIAHEWLDRNIVVVEGVRLDLEWDNSGLDITVYKHEDEDDDNPDLLARKEKWDTFIPWSEFDYQKDCTYLAKNSISAINTIDFEKIAGEGAHDWSWSLNKDGDKYVLWSWA